MAENPGASAHDDEIDSIMATSPDVLDDEAEGADNEADDSAGSQGRLVPLVDCTTGHSDH